MSEYTVGRIVDLGEIKERHADVLIGNEKRPKINALGSKDMQDIRDLIAEVERLRAEVSALWELADSAVLASLKLDKKVGGELIRLRSNLGLSRDSGSPDLSKDRQPIDSDTSCKWVEVDEYDCTTWETDCGRKWEFMADGPVENDIKYCHGCGKPIELSAPDGREKT